MLDKLKLSVFESIVKGIKIENERELNESLESGETFSRHPEELCHYTKEDTTLKFADISGLDQVKISFGPQNKKKRQKKRENEPPLIGACLSEGFHDFVSSNLDTVYSLDDIFKSVQHLIENNTLSRDKLKVLTTRRHLMKLMSIPLNKQPVSFDVIYWRGLIIFAYDWDKELREVSDNFQKMYQYSGFQFERVATGKPHQETASSFYTVVQHTVGQNNVTYSAEIDCAVSLEPGLHNYVELKTHATLPDDKLKTANKLQRKLMVLYCQNKFISCKYSAIGFRSQNFRLVSLKKYTEYELVGLLDTLPIFLTHSCSIKTKHIFQWYNLVICWLSQRQFDDDKPHVFKLRFQREDELMDSHLSMDSVPQEEETQIFNKLVPEWFQNFY
ncbi:DXO1 [Candida metapsilosis]|uniref:Decapping nuclease n=1 Tax=Candida metapsilosis TaxID=273372 RepID=A0A8H7ZIE3_9ASCO|nr:DXO1 [Candida metapsilosis]